MRSIYYCYLLFILFLCPSTILVGQVLPPNQPEQDCFNAIPVCQPQYRQLNSYQGEGVLSSEIPSDVICLKTGEKNDVWYIFTVQTSGDLCFSIAPIDPNNDYDWAVFNLTNASCADIGDETLTASLTSSCNFEPSFGCSGITGANGLLGPLDCPGQNEACIPVVAGETYVLNVSNFSANNSGYDLDFGASTANIFDNIPPQMMQADGECSNVTIQFSENTLCSSVTATDFQVTDQLGTIYPIQSVSGVNCETGGGFESVFELSFVSALAPGNYSITLVGGVEDNCGNLSNGGLLNFTIAAFPLTINSVADTVCQGSSAELSTSLDPAAVSTYSWTPGGSTSATALIPLTVNTNVTARVIDTAGCTYDGARAIAVKAVPSADFTVTADSICPTEAVTLNYTGSGTSMANLDWDLDGGLLINGSGLGPYTVRWDDAGNKNLGLVVTENDCPSPQNAQAILVHDIPTSTFEFEGGACVNQPVTINYTGSASNSAIYTWDFGTGAIAGANTTGQGPYEIVWTTPGAQSVSLRVNEFGCNSLLESSDATVFSLPVASTTPISDQCLKGNQFDFAYNGNSVINEYHWDFGDGDTSILATPSHQYALPGLKTITLTITDENGCINTVVSSATVFSPPIADFVASSVCLGDTIPLTNLSIDTSGATLVKYRWDLDNGQLQSGELPNLVYTEAGNYTLELIASDINGCPDTARRDITIYPIPEANFDVKSACLGSPITFSNTSSIDASISGDMIDQWTWDFGDGNVLQGENNPQYTYPDQGTYMVSLSVTSNNSCRANLQLPVGVFPEPNLPNLANDTICSGETSLLQVSNDPSRQIYWYDSDTASTPFFIGESFLTPPIINEQAYFLEAVSAEGCTSSNRSAVSVFPFQQGTGGIFASDSVVELPSAILGFGTIGGIQGERYEWKFGDGFSSIAASPVHEYQFPGRYTVSLELVDRFQCEYSFETEVEVKKIVFVHVPSAFSPNNDGFNDEFFVNTRLLNQFQLRIFNRLGKLVYQTNDPGFRWDGLTTTGQLVKEGVYVVQLQAVDITGIKIQETNLLTVLY